MKFLLDHDVPDDIIYSLLALGHELLKLRDVSSVMTPDEEVLRMAAMRNRVLITCNRDDFLAISRELPHAGIVILIRRRSRALERAALIQLLDRAGESGIRGNINFA